MTEGRGSIRVLHVDDEADFAELTAEFLEREGDAISTRITTSATAALEELADTQFDCIVSDYDMPGKNGIEFLETVREDHPDIPFILFTGKGSEEVASEAFSAGATDYLQKEGDTGQFTVLANQIENAVDQYRARRRAEQQHNQYRDLFEHAPVMYILIRDDDGEPIIEYCNERFAAKLGYDRDDIIGRSTLDFYTTESAAEAREGYDRALNSEFYREERTFRTKDGMQLDTLVQATPRHDQQGNVIGVMALYVDISAQNAREELQERHELVARASTDAFWDWDPLNDEITRSEEYLRQFGYESAEVAADTDWWRERIHPADRERVLSALNEAVEDPEATYDETYRFRKKDGTYGYLRSRGYVVYDDHGEPKRMVGAHTDITERKERERERRETERRLQAVLDTVDTGIFMKDAEGNYQLFNDRMREMLGIDDHTQVIGKTASDLFPAETADQFEENDRRVREKGEPMRIEEKVPTPRGLETHLTIKSPVFGDDGEVTGVCAVSTDITERVEDRQRLEQQKDRLEEFASIVSHDLRNPLSVAEGRLTLAAKECDSENLEAARSALDRMDQLIDRTLTLARSGRVVGETESVALSSLVEQCWRNVETDNADLRIVDAPEVEADPERLQHLFENLFRNSVEHGGNGVIVSVGGLDDGFYVEDNGPGIPKGDRDEVFTAGYSTREDGPGVGLSIVKEISDAHGWTIAVTDGENGGARFELTDVKVGR